MKLERHRSEPVDGKPWPQTQPLLMYVSRAFLEHSMAPLLTATMTDGPRLKIDAIWSSLGKCTDTSPDPWAQLCHRITQQAHQPLDSYPARRPRAGGQHWSSTQGGW